MKRALSILLASLLPCLIFAQTSERSLRGEISRIIASQKADIGVSVRGLENGDTLSFNGSRHYPMISVFKFHIALAVLHQVDEGTLSLSRKIPIQKKDLSEDTWSPFRKKYPDGRTISLQEALEWMIIYSDNNICDLLIKLAGGVKVIEEFIDSPDCIIRNDEQGMHQSWEAQFRNTTTPSYTTLLLTEFFEKKILGPGSTQFLYTTMAATAVGDKRIKGKLPPGTEVAHRTGSSFTNEEGLTGAINDIGIVTLPDGTHFAIAIFVHNTRESFDTGEAIIADIARAVWDHYTTK